jgi:phage gp29-like protein
MADIPKKPDFREIAVSRDREMFAGYVGEIIGTHDPVLRGLGGDLDEYRRLLRDHQVKSCWQQRIRAVTSAEWDVEPGGSSTADKMAADWLRETLHGLRWDAVTAKMAHAQMYGYAVGECLYARDGQRVALDAIKVRRQERFGFDVDGNLRYLRHPGDAGAPVPPAKFWVLAADGDNDDDPHGLGLCHWLYWPVFLKRNGAVFWATALEKFGMPTAVGTYPEGADDPQSVTNLLAALRAIHGSSAVAFPAGFEYKLLEAVRTSGGDHERWMRYWDAAITKIILSQTMTTEDGSSRAQAEVHQDVADDVTKADADLLCESFNRSPVRWLTAWNFPTARPPRVWRRVEQQEDLTDRAKRDQVIAQTTGLRPTARYVHDTFGGEWEATPAATAQGAASPEFDEGVRDATDDLVDQVGTLAAPAIEGLYDQMRAILDRAIATGADFAEVQRELLALTAGPPPERLAEVMGQAMILSHLGGAVEMDEDDG